MARNICMSMFSFKDIKMSLMILFLFRLYEEKFQVNQCGNNTATTRHLYGDYSAASQFYVFVGVMAFLYCIAIVVFYVFGDDKYRNFEMIPIIVSMICCCYVALNW